MWSDLARCSSGDIVDMMVGRYTVIFGQLRSNAHGCPTKGECQGGPVYYDMFHNVWWSWGGWFLRGYREGLAAEQYRYALLQLKLPNWRIVFIQGYTCLPWLAPCLPPRCWLLVPATPCPEVLHGFLAHCYSVHLGGEGGLPRSPSTLNLFHRYDKHQAC